MLIPYHKQNDHVLLSSAYYFEQVNEQAATSQGSTAKIFSSSNVFDGSKQPGFRKLIRSQQNATTIASGSKTTYTDQYVTGTCRADFGAQKVRRTAVGSMLGMSNFSDLFPALTGSPDISQIQNEALLGYLKKCRQAQRQFQGGVFVGELEETLHLIKRPAAAIRELLFDYVQGVRRRARALSAHRTLRHISNSWLEASFGMLPFVSDIQDAVSALQRLYLNLPIKYVREVVSRKFSGSSQTIPGNMFSQNIPVLLNTGMEREYGVKIVGGVLLKQPGNLAYGSVSADAFGLGIRDFIPTIYELIPYSFLVDYFTNIGGLLEAASFNQATLAWHSYTTFTKDVQWVSLVPANPGTLFGAPVIDYYVTPGLVKLEVKTFNRSAPPLGLPLFAFKVPGDWSKFLNIGALASLRVL
jgi:hypothetical protein